MPFFLFGVFSGKERMSINKQYGHLRILYGMPSCCLYPPTHEKLSLPPPPVCAVLGKFTVVDQFHLAEAGDSQSPNTVTLPVIPSSDCNSESIQS